MFRRPLLVLAIAAGLTPFAPLSAAPLTPPVDLRPAAKVDIGKIMGRWYEIARVPNKLQNGCVSGTSDFARTAGGFSVVEACTKGGSVARWKGHAKVLDTESNARLKMTFFGGMVSQDYLVLDHRADHGWLILSTANGKYLWLMSQKPALEPPVRAQALARIRQLGFDVGRLEFPALRGG